ncbi:MAG: hypothetical protein H0W15_05830 [Gemmatimonadales bacterium]|nr:hypothetical protein [Gemmatimonadales bacterium]
MRLTLCFLALIGVALQRSSPASAQAAVTPVASTARLRIFLDCATHCDGEYLRSEIRIVDWVTDRNASDIYVLATSQRTGAGGNDVALEFIGRGGELDGLTDRHTFQTAPDATNDEFRSEFARVLRLGLVRYLLASDRARSLILTGGDVDELNDRAQLPTTDPWNFWVFNIQLDGQLNAESKEKGTEVELELNASRITDAWKLQFELAGSLDRNTYELDDGRRVRATRDRWNADALLGRSLGPQWSAGIDAGALGAKRENLDLRLRFAPVIEYDAFPYAEAHRRRLILQYSLGINRYEYVEETVYSRLQETRLDQRLRVEYRTRQPWGGASLTGTAEAFLHDLGQNRLGIDGDITVRLAKGLGLDIEASYSKVRNQITLPKGSATDDEIFLDLRQRATNYQAQVAVGISYTFGSFLNSVVNPRFNNLD